MVRVKLTLLVLWVYLHITQCQWKASYRRWIQHIICKLCCVNLLDHPMFTREGQLQVGLHGPHIIDTSMIRKFCNFNVHNWRVENCSPKSVYLTSWQTDLRTTLMIWWLCFQAHRQWLYHSQRYVHHHNGQHAKLSGAGAWLIFGGGENNICHVVYAWRMLASDVYCCFARTCDDLG